MKERKYWRTSFRYDPGLKEEIVTEFKKKIKFTDLKKKKKRETDLNINTSQVPIITVGPIITEKLT